MERKRNIDTFGVVALIAFSLTLGFNQVVIKVGNDGFQPVFGAGLRSFGAVICLLAWMWLRGIPVRIRPGTARYGLLLGAFFSVEFLLLFTALDLTTVSRTSIIFYTMPVWTTLAAHFLLDGERLSRMKAVGLAMAFIGVVVAIGARGGGGQESLAGDLCALGAALCWTGIALTARAPAMEGVGASMALLWQIAISAMVLIPVSFLFGPPIRDLAPIHVWAMAFQIVIVAFMGFLIWFWLLGRYPAGQVAAFGFLSPVIGAFLGWALLGEQVGPSLVLAAALVAGGLLLINRPPGGFRFRRRSA
ncbi:DMT family transporter [Oceaniglobus indicus]|uniref:DMT family transporter n=1 Tax=Oceaniglobus indicus TaxID=2047749 RepID=UPI000C19A192|nr:DMT family transporter [Oceaniglobus indicus]